MDTQQIIEQLTIERDRIDAAIKLLSGSDTTTFAKVLKGTRKKRKMSAAARKKISEAMKKRWAKQKKA